MTKLQYEWQSFHGTLTKDNRDYCGVANHKDATLYIVVDGATRGPRGGELARALTQNVVDGFHSFDQEITNSNICDLLKEIHKKLQREFCADSASYFILIHEKNGSILTFHAGDCRLGAIKKQNEIDWLSQPHTLANAIADLAESDLASHPARHVLTRSFKSRTFEAPEHTLFPALPSDTLIIATDGFWAEITKDQRGTLLMEAHPPESRRDDQSFLILRKNNSAITAQSKENIYVRG